MSSLGWPVERGQDKTTQPGTLGWPRVSRETSSWTFDLDVSRETDLGSTQRAGKAAFESLPQAATETASDPGSGVDSGVSSRRLDQIAEDAVSVVPPPAVASGPVAAELISDNHLDRADDGRATLLRELDVSRETEPAKASDGIPTGDATPDDPPTDVASDTWRPPPTQRIFTVANQKGGVGKTTSTVNVAAAMASHGLRVLVVDLDPQGNASTAFDIAHNAGVLSTYELLVTGAPVRDVAQPVASFPHLHCVPATIDLAGAEIELVSVVARESRLAKALKAVADDYDYVFIDCPPSLGLLTINAMVAAAEVLIPIQCEFYALEGLSQLLKNIELVKAHLNPDLHVSTILLTMYDARTRLADQVADEVRSHFGPLVLDSIIPRSVRISEAPGFGQTVVTYDPASRGAKAYEAAARDIAARAHDKSTGEAQI